MASLFVEEFLPFCKECSWRIVGTNGNVRILYVAVRTSIKLLLRLEEYGNKIQYNTINPNPNSN